MLLRKIYYLLKPFVPRRLQIYLRQNMIRHKLPTVKDVWPIDANTAKPPPNWNGWPQEKKFALVLTHDVETQIGHDKCLALMEMEKMSGFLSSFYFVPERYRVSPDLRRILTQNGFEIGVHGLTHDGKLYQSERLFNERASKINYYLKEWNVCGFRSPAMHHNLEWIGRLNIKYDASTFDTDPFEPQSDGVRTIFPFWVDKVHGQNGYVELPYTLPQDFTLFILLKEKDASIWKQKLDWLAEQGGMALVNVHPDYINFDNGELSREEFPVQYYLDFLDYVKTNYSGQYWQVLPGEMARYWKAFHFNRKNRESTQISET